jgi:hypothetical protein
MVDDEFLPFFFLLMGTFEVLLPVSPGSRLFSLDPESSLSVSLSLQLGRFAAATFIGNAAKCTSQITLKVRIAPTTYTVLFISC